MLVSDSPQFRGRPRFRPEQLAPARERGMADKWADVPTAPDRPAMDFARQTEVLFGDPKADRRNAAGPSLLRASAMLLCIAIGTAGAMTIVYAACQVIARTLGLD